MGTIRIEGFGPEYVHKDVRYSLVALDGEVGDGSIEPIRCVRLTYSVAPPDDPHP